MGGHNFIEDLAERRPLFEARADLLALIRRSSGGVGFWRWTRPCSFRPPEWSRTSIPST